ncbi:hypothetical protein [Pseudomonas sp. EA_105y_Pfl2_R69]|uniref:hypothetical protein n=1 Tax=Pseudomonas sp. EA_105y_Pfl2_R69 TaxID=3088683 RepID=UPI0030D9CBB4
MTTKLGAIQKYIYNLSYMTKLSDRLCKKKGTAVKNENIIMSIARQIIATLIFVACAPVSADPAPLGLELGQATVSDMEKTLPAADRHQNSHTGGPFFTYLNKSRAPLIREALFHFDQNDKLAATKVFIDRDRWVDVLNGINEKYKRSNYVFHKDLVKDGKVYLAPHTPALRPLSEGHYVFQEGDTIIYASSQDASIFYFTLAIHPKLAGNVEKLRSDRLKAMVRQL